MMTPSLETTVMTSGEPATTDSKSASRSSVPEPAEAAREDEPAEAGVSELGDPMLAPCCLATIRSSPVTTRFPESSAVTTRDVCWRSITQSSIEPVTGGHLVKSIAPIAT